jgi:hypothetical protein
MDTTTSSIIDILDGKNDEVAGTHYGVIVMPVKENDELHYTIFQHIQVKRERMGVNGPEPYEFAAFVDLDSVIVLRKAVEDIFVPAVEDPGYSLEHLDIYSELFRDMLKDPLFRKLDGKRQQQAVDAFVSRAEEQNYLNGYFFDGAPQKVYGPYMSPEGMAKHAYMASEIPVKGLCVGLLPLEARITDDNPIRTDADMIDPRAGLCMVVIADDETAEALQLEPETPLFIPLSNQEFQASLYDQAMYQQLVEAAPLDPAMQIIKAASDVFDQTFARLGGNADNLQLVDQMKALVHELNLHAPIGAEISISSSLHEIDWSYGEVGHDGQKDTDPHKYLTLRGRFVRYFVTSYYENPGDPRPKPVLATILDTTMYDAELGMDVQVYAITPVRNAKITLQS